MWTSRAGAVQLHHRTGLTDGAFYRANEVRAEEHPLLAQNRFNGMLPPTIEAGTTYENWHR